MSDSVFMKLKRTGQLLGIGAVAAGLLVAKLACGHATAITLPAKPATPAAAMPAQPFDAAAPVRLEALGTPIESSRTWATALAPNSRGGWNFITQSFELFGSKPSEFIVVDLQTGQTTITEGATGVYTNARYTYKNELRAPNGRIFFPESSVSVAYYDPADETVKELGKLIDPVGPEKNFYKGTFGPDGMLYLGSQSNDLPTIVQLDPVTLKSRILGHVGRTRLGYSFAHDFAVDPPWIYVAVGENPWELAALNIDTGESRILATRADNGWMKVEVRPEGTVATLIAGLRTPAQKEETVWCVDGKTLPLDPHYDPAHLPFKPRALPRHQPLVNPPELRLDSLKPDAAGVGHLSWRPAGATGPWTQTPFPVKYTLPIAIESLLALPDGSVLGNAVQYHGFFRFDPTDKSTTDFGGHGPSRPVHAILDGIVYISGYPNGITYAYDPTKPWRSTGKDEDDRKDPLANPQVIGPFAPSRTKYATALKASSRGRLYYAGRRERDGVGGGVGYYDVATKQFGGNADNLELLNPDGLAVLDGLKRVVYSGHLPPLAPKRDGAPVAPEPGMPAEAPLVVYDQDLNEVERLVVKPGLRGTGQLFTTADPNVIIGVAANEHVIYRYDVARKQLLDSKDLPGAIGDMTQRPSDGSIWVVIDHGLVRFDPVTLAATRVGPDGLLPDKAENLTWQGDALYLSDKGTLYRIINDEGSH